MDFSAALAEAEAINRASPDDIAGYQLMAAAQLELGDYGDAEKQLQWMLDLRIGKADSQGWLLVARFREVTGDLDGALDAVNLAYGRLAPGQERRTAGRGRLRRTPAVSCGQSSIWPARRLSGWATSPEAAPSLLETLARVRLAQGKREEAIGILRRLTARVPHPRTCICWRRRPAAAADYAAFEAAARSLPHRRTTPTGNWRCITPVAASSRPRRSRSRAGESLRRHDVFTLDALAVALFANRQTAEARSIMQRVLAVGTRDPEILEHAARDRSEAAMIAKLACLASAAQLFLAAQHMPRIPVSTDQRIAAIEPRLKQAPTDAGLRNDLAGAYLQKMRETADGAYLERAGRIVAAILKTDPAHYDARRRQTRDRDAAAPFPAGRRLAASLVRERPNDAAVWGMLGDAAWRRAITTARPTPIKRWWTCGRTWPATTVWRSTGSSRATRRVQSRSCAGPSAPDRRSRRILRGALPISGACCSRPALRRGGAGVPAGARHFPAITRRWPVWAVCTQPGAVSRGHPTLLAAQAKAPFPEYTGLLAKLYRKTGKADLARRQIALLDVADKLDRAAGETANRNLSLALSDLGHRPDRALELARAELKVRQDVYTYDALAWALFQNGKLEEAADAIQRALSQNSPEPSFHDHAARIFEAQGRVEETKLHRDKARPDW